MSEYCNRVNFSFAPYGIDEHLHQCVEPSELAVAVRNTSGHHVVTLPGARFTSQPDNTTTAPNVVVAIHRDRTIGKGSYGIVYEGEVSMPDGRAKLPCAVKFLAWGQPSSAPPPEPAAGADPSQAQVLKKPQPPPRKLDLHGVVREAMIQMLVHRWSAQHAAWPFVPEVYVMYRTSSGVYIVMERMDGNVLQLVNACADQPRQDALVASISCQTAWMLDMLQRRFGFNHRDLKLDNVLFRKVPVDRTIAVSFEDGAFYPMPTRGVQTCLADFGFACMDHRDVELEGTHFFVDQERRFGVEERVCNMPSRDLTQFAFWCYTFVKWRQPEASRVRAEMAAVLRVSPDVDLTKSFPTTNQTWSEAFRQANWKTLYRYLHVTAMQNPNATPKAIFFRLIPFAHGASADEKETEWIQQGISFDGGGAAVTQAAVRNRTKDRRGRAVKVAVRDGVRWTRNARRNSSLRPLKPKNNNNLRLNSGTAKLNQPGATPPVRAPGARV